MQSQVRNPLGSAPALASADPVPLCVDLDGTLVKSDMLLESLVAAVKRRPLLAFALPFWLARGRAALKRELALRAEIDVAVLPYDEAVLQRLRDARAQGRTVVLATAADATIARAEATNESRHDTARM